jgi:hypothetical protein
LLKQIKVCILKQVWETTNSAKRLLFSLITNCLMLLWVFFRTHNSSFMGLNFISIVLLYVIIWCVMMSFTLVNDIITETNDAGIIEQIFMSSCNLSRYTFIQIMNKGIFSIVFITIILTICNFITHTFEIATILSFFVTMIIGVFSIIGTGYIISSISLLVNYKNISLLLRMLFLVIIIKSDKNIFIPFSYCKYNLIKLFSDNIFIWNQSSLDIIGLIINSAIYFVLGIVVFSKITSKKFIIHEDF